MSIKVKVKRRKLVSLTQSGVWDLERDGITQSFISKWLACPESARLRYAKGLVEKVPADYLTFGDVFHRGLEGGFDLVKDSRFQLSPEEARNESVCTVQRLEASKVLYPHTDLEKILGLIEATLWGYFDFWGKKDIATTWVALEEEIETEVTVLGTTFRIRAKIDGLSERKERLTLKETKTKGRVDEVSIAKRLTLDFQTLLYLWLVRRKYGRFAGNVLYDIVRRTQLRQGKAEPLKKFLDRVKKDIAERPEWYFIRFKTLVTEAELDEWERKQLWPILGQIVRWHRKEFHYQNPYSCTNGNYVCPYLSLCSSGDGSGLVKTTKAHAELGT